jgi:D-sedoheptulose 7-phosphate isomerase
MYDNIQISQKFENYYSRTKFLQEKIPIPEIQKLLEAILQIKSSKKTLFLIGNGGSSSTAQHFSCDIGVGSYLRKNPVRTLSLLDNSAILTALGNDTKFEDIFATQVSLLAKPGDMLLAFSASGNSENLINAIKIASEMELVTASLTGFDGGVLKQISDISVHIDSPKGEYGIVEDIHLMICHFITECIREIDFE